MWSHKKLAGSLSKGFLQKKQYVDSTYQVHAQRTFCSSSYHQQLQLEHAGLSLALPNNMDLFFLVCYFFFGKGIWAFHRTCCCVLLLHDQQGNFTPYPTTHYLVPQHSSTNGPTHRPKCLRSWLEIEQESASLCWHVFAHDVWADWDEGGLAMAYLFL